MRAPLAARREPAGNQNERQICYICFWKKQNKKKRNIF